MLLDHQPAAGRPVGAAAEGALPADVPGDPDVLLHRHLLDQLAADRHHVHRLLRPRRLSLIKFGFEPAPLLLGFVLGKLMEENLRRALILSRGDMMTFVEHAVSAGLLLVSVILLVLALLPAMRKGRDEVFVE